MNTINSLSLTVDFVSALEATGAKVITVGRMEEIIVIYHKSGGGMDDVLNTIPSIGRVNIADIASPVMPLHQAWVLGGLAVAENGLIWLQDPVLLDKMVPFVCDQFIVVLDERNIVAKMRSIPAFLTTGKKMSAMMMPSSSEPEKSELYFMLGHHRSKQMIVYLIDRENKVSARQSSCGQNCDCRLTPNK